MQPRFHVAHLNRENSVFLGTTRMVETGVGRDRESDYDLFLVWTENGGFDLVSRYGNRPDQEYFGYGLSFGKFDTLTEARKRAEEQGLIAYDVYMALDVLVSQDTGAEISEGQHACLTEMVQRLETCNEMQAFNAFRERDVQRTQALMKDLVKDAERRGLQGSLSWQLRAVLNNVLRISTIVTSLKGLAVNTTSVVQALSYRAPKLVK